MSQNTDRAAPTTAPTTVCCSLFALAQRTFATTALTTAALAQTVRGTLAAPAPAPAPSSSAAPSAPSAPSAPIDEDDDWHLVTAEDFARPAPSGPPDTEEALARKWKAVEKRLNAAIRAGDAAGERVARAAMSGVSSRMARLERERVERERQAGRLWEFEGKKAEVGKGKEAEVGKGKEGEEKEGEEKGGGSEFRKRVLRGMRVRVFKKQDGGGGEKGEGEDSENSFYRDDEDEEESAEVALSKHEEDDTKDDDEPVLWEDAVR
ncbi:hypothetical protein B0T18DRAFT_466689 [Schizothecium vesticola]|uniref:Uncharacterized protein n=1 Tax=Schizothecium vesticola TaxID=314040 RepID=A0AA40EWZ0_9PEZI|nr:hypothetical protein B0T18DRAFT_466689 [Schizothecium vesticola]